jgi:hypothetical protein
MSRIRGIRQSIRQGSFLGRTAAGVGPAEEVTTGALVNAVVASGQVLTSGGGNPQQWTAGRVSGLAYNMVITNGSLDITISPHFFAVSQTGPAIVDANTGGGTPAGFPQGTIFYMAGQDGQPATQLLEAWGQGGVRYRGRRAQGTRAAPTALHAGDGIFEISAQGYDGAAYSGVTTELFSYAIENWTTTAHGTALALNVVAAGTTTLTTGAVVIGNGTSGILMLGTLAQTGTNPAWANGPRLQVVDQNGLLANVVNIGTDNTAVNIQMGGTLAPTDTQPAGSLKLSTAGLTYVSQGGGTWTRLGTVYSIIAGTGLSGGTITGSGTINLGTIAASSLMGNASTVGAVPTAIAVGAGLSLSTAGTLSSTVTGGITTIVAGSNLTGGTITSSGTVALANAITLSSGTLTGLAAPVAGGDATNKTYVDNIAAALNPAVAVQAATTTAANTSSFTYNNGVSGVGATFTGTVNTAVTIDGFTFTVLGQRLLVKNDTQTPSGAFNGVYYVTQVQTSLLPPILTRALDYDQTSDMNNTGAIPVVNGTVNGGTSWLLTSTVTTVGASPLTYSQFSLSIANSWNAGGVTTLGANLSINSGTISATDTNIWNAGTVTTVANGISLNSGTLGLQTITATSLLGNSGTVAATPTAIAMGANMTLTAGTLSSGAGGGGGSGIGTIVAAGITSSASLVALAGGPILTPTFTTWFNQGSSLTVATNTNGPTALTLTGNAGSNNVRGRYKSLAAGNFTLSTNFLFYTGTGGSNTPSAGVFLTDGTKAAIWDASYGRATPSIQLNTWTNATTFGSTLFSQNVAGLPQPLWFNVGLSGTVYTFSFALDGFNFRTLGTATPATLGFTPNNVGIGVEEFAASASTPPYIFSLNFWTGA